MSDPTVTITVTQARYYLRLEDTLQRLNNLLKQDVFARFNGVFDAREEDKDGARLALIEQIDAIEKHPKK